MPHIRARRYQSREPAGCSAPRRPPFTLPPPRGATLLPDERPHERGGEVTGLPGVRVRGFVAAGRLPGLLRGGRRTRPNAVLGPAVRRVPLRDRPRAARLTRSDRERDSCVISCVI